MPQRPSPSPVARLSRFHCLGLLGTALLATACGSRSPLAEAGPVEDTASVTNPGPSKGSTTDPAEDSLVVLDEASLDQTFGVALRGNGRNVTAAPEMLFSAGKESILRTQNSSGVFVVQDYEHLPILRVRIPSEAARNALLANPLVAMVAPNARFEATDIESFRLINQAPALAQGKDGQGTAVAVLDTGADYTRSDFGSCTAPGFPASTCRVAFAKDFAPEDNAADKGSFHGTNTAGIVAGTAPGTKILALDVFDGDYAYAATIIDAINWVIANKTTYNIAAINMSLGGGRYTSPCRQDVMGVAIRNARNAGILSAVSSGNNGYSDAISSPACAPAAVSVGAVYDTNLGGWNWGSCTDATTGPDKVVCFSNSANFLSILAPGVQVTAGGLTYSGTSMAAPHVAGALATLRAAFPTATADELFDRLTRSGKGVVDARNGISKPRLDFGAAFDTCSLQVSPAEKRLDSAAGSFALDIKTGPDCPWQASSSAPWLEVAGASSGKGNGTVTVNATVNEGPVRTGSLTVSGASTSATVSVSQGPDNLAPTGTLTINAGAAATVSANVTLRVEATDAHPITEMCVSSTNECSAFEPFVSPKAWTVPSGDGTKPVYVFLRDSVGNTTSSAQSLKAEILLDTTPPAGGTLTVTRSGSSDSLQWSGFTDAGSGIDLYRLVAAPNAAPADCGTGTVVYEGPATGFVRSGIAAVDPIGYRVCAIDKVGNGSAGATTVATNTDTTPPLGSLVINRGRKFTRSSLVLLDLKASDAGGVASMCISTTPTCTAFEPFATSKVFRLGAADGLVTVYAWFKDNAGNISASPATASITLDRLGPVMGSFTASAGSRYAFLNWTAASDVTSPVVQYRLVYTTGSLAPAAGCDSGTLLHVGSVPRSGYHNNLRSGATYNYRLCAIDAAGNSSDGILASVRVR